ncbi:zinc-binding alcohol dehydrogenase [Geminicoccaceae bacterium 1502E]|nr:zinc-binding alcohol dehydrogenase [Geminicoccaceae bacterium 1502E]
MARAYWATGPLEGEIREAALVAPRPGEVLVRTLFTGISRGTEALVATGGVPASQHERMRCPFQEGDFPFPVKYGYGAVGLVEEGPAGLLGRQVFCLHPHQTRFVVPAGSVVALPDGVPAERAVLAANMETALNGLWDGAVLPGDRVAVIGAGVVGALVAWLAGQIPGTEVVLADLDPAKAKLAVALGVAFARPGEVPGGNDLVVEASGSGEALAGTLALAGDEGTVLALGWYGATAPALPLGEDFHGRRLRLVSSQVGMVPAARRARWSTRRRLEKALKLLGAPVLDVLISGESDFAELPSVMRRLAGGPGGTLCQRIRYDKAPSR